jgi:hypothetical protein
MGGYIIVPSKHHDLSQVVFCSFWVRLMMRLGKAQRAITVCAGVFAPAFIYRPGCRRDGRGSDKKITVCLKGLSMEMADLIWGTRVSEKNWLLRIGP